VVDCSRKASPRCGFPLWKRTTKWRAISPVLRLQLLCLGLPLEVLRVTGFRNSTTTHMLGTRMNQPRSRPWHQYPIVATSSRNLPWGCILMDRSSMAQRINAAPAASGLLLYNNQHNCNPCQPPIKFSKFLLRRLVIASFWSICHWAMRTEMVMVPGCSVHPGCNSNTLLEHKSNVLGGRP